MGADGADLVRRYVRRLWGLTLAANYFGISLTLFYAYFFFRIYPDEEFGQGELLLRVLVPAAPLLILATVGGWFQTGRTVRPRLAWLAERRKPTPEERRAVFAIPRWSATLGWVYWLVALIVLLPYAFIVVDYDMPRSAAIRGVVAVLLLSIVPWSLTYLFTERAMGRIFAEAFSEDAPLPKTMSLPSRLVLAWLGTSGLPIAGIVLLFLGQDAVHRERAVPALFMECIGGGLAGIAVAAFSGRAIIDPLGRVRNAMRAIERGHLDTRIPVSESAELGELQAGFNRMAHGLRDRERMREIFGHHVGPDVAARAISREFALGGETVEATAMFVDMIASSALAEHRPPDEVVAILNRYFDAVVRCVDAEGGYVSKFEGDGAMCIFGAPLPLSDHAERALRAARALRAELRSLSEDIDAAIGISSGQVVAGNVGAANRYEYTIIGDAVNEASRLTDEAKYRHTRVLASESTIGRAGAELRNWGHSGTIPLRGRARPTVAFEPGLI